MVFGEQSAIIDPQAILPTRQYLRHYAATLPLVPARESPLNPRSTSSSARRTFLAGGHRHRSDLTQQKSYKDTVPFPALATEQPLATGQTGTFTTPKSWSNSRAQVAIHSLTTKTVTQTVAMRQVDTSNSDGNVTDNFAGVGQCSDNVTLTAPCR